MKVDCSQCGAMLDRPPSRLRANANQYCDMQCLGAHRRRPVDLSCAVCSQTVTVKASRATQNEAITCSMTCLSELRSRNRIDHFGTAEDRIADCAECGQSFTRKPSQIAKYGLSFCSRECRSRHITLGEWVSCEICHSDVWRKPSSERRFCSTSCRDVAVRGSNSPVWKGGASIVPYTEGWGRWRSREIRERDGHRCRVCGEAESLVVHHIDMAKFDHTDRNLITLCRPCHSAVHVGRIILDQEPEPSDETVDFAPPV